MKLSIVATLYQSAPYIYEFYARAHAVAKELVGEEFEIVLVNDGSPDHSLDLAIKLTEQDSHVVVVDLSRNFGHHKAIMTGLAHASGELVFLIDSDLEEDPEWLLSFYEKMQKEGCDVVFGVQSSRKGGLFEVITGWIFWKLINKLSDLNIHENQVTSRLMTKSYCKSLLLHNEREVFFGGICHITGYSQKPNLVKKKKTSPTTYSITHKLDLLISSITSFSAKPLVYLFLFGLSLSVISLFYAFFLILRWLYLDTVPAGFTSIMASISFFSSVIIMAIGLVGMYVSKLFMEVKNRPVIVKKIYKNAN
jgi:putative glycosyltransferase